ncbi:MAG: transposase [Armatimonadetes bacterium]|nr:transposase [Armatimonadota bacterium]
MTSDAGLIALREFDERIGFTDCIARCLRDRRHSSYVRHDLKQLIIQRLHGIIGGCEDQNDAQRLRCAQTDPVPYKLFKVGALIRHSTRRFWLHLASGWPHEDLVRSALRDVGQLSVPTRPLAAFGPSLAPMTFPLLISTG